MSLQYLLRASSNSNQTSQGPDNLSPAPGKLFPGAGTQFPPAPRKSTHFFSILNECDLSPAPRNSFPGAGAQLSPALGKPTHLSSLVERMLLVLKRSSKLAGRRRADLSPVPERKLRTHQRWETKSSRCLIKHHLHQIKPAGVRLTFPWRRTQLSPCQDTSFPGAGKTYASFFVDGTNVTRTTNWLLIKQTNQPAPG